MRIAFFGHRMIAQRTLSRLVSGGVEVVGILAHPDSFTPSDPQWSVAVRELAAEARIPLLMPDRLDDAFLATFRAWNVDLGVVVGFLKILKAPLIEAARCGFVNVHAGMLPRYRGRAPLAWAILNGEKEAGLTVHMVDEGVDSGPIVAQRRYSIGPGETAGELYDRIALDVPDLVLDVVASFEAGTITARPQDEDQATVFPLLTAAHGRIDWERPAGRIHDQVRALARPYAGAWTLHEGKRLTIWKASLAPVDLPDSFPGTVVNRWPGRGVVVATGAGYLLVEEVQVEDGRPQPAAEAMRRAGVSLGFAGG